MRVTVIDGLPADSRLAEVAVQTLRDAGWLHAHHRLRSEQLAPCDGCLGCWAEHPGVCGTQDAANEVMADVVAAEAVLWLTKPRFGCWDHVCKRAIDRSLGLLSPFVQDMESGAVQHKRYDHYPRWVVLALGAAQADFEELVRRNAAEFRSATAVVRWVDERGSDGRLNREVLAALVSLETKQPEATAQVPYAEPPTPDWIESRPEEPHAVVWVGSGKASGTSSSEALGRALAEELQRWGWSYEVIHAQDAVRRPDTNRSYLVTSAEHADLLVLASPVYVDSLPSAVLRGLAQLADAGLVAPPALLPIVQCGFPELHHTTTALLILRRAAQEIGLGWAGFLAMGGGAAIGGGPLSQPRLAPQREALAEAAVELDAGRSVAPETRARFATALLSTGLHRLLGQAGWVLRALRAGTMSTLWDRPFDEDDEPSGPSKTLEV